MAAQSRFLGTEQIFSCRIIILFSGYLKMRVNLKLKVVWTFLAPFSSLLLWLWLICMLCTSVPLYSPFNISFFTFKHTHTHTHVRTHSHTLLDSLFAWIFCMVLLLCICVLFYLSKQFFYSDFYFQSLWVWARKMGLDDGWLP